MDQVNGKSLNWQDGGEFWESTSEPSIAVAMIEEEAPTLTVAAIIGVTLVVIVAIVAVFVLGVLIDCRQQRILAKQMKAAKRPKNQRRVSAHPDGEGVTIVDTMEEPELTVPPATILRNIP